MKKKVIFFCFIFFSCLSAGEGFELESKIYIQNSNGGVNPPFWFNSNRNGEYGKNKNKAGEILKIDYSKNMGKYRIKTAFSEIGYTSQKDKSKINKIYIELSKNNLYISTGKMEFPYINPKSENGSGSILAGNNSYFPPRVIIGSKGYLNVPYTKGILQIGGNFSNGILDDKKECGKPLLHEKEFYLSAKLNKNNSIYGGISHSVIWGGEYQNKKLNTSFKDFMSIVFAQKTASSGVESEDENMIGDHKGVHELGYKITGKKIDTDFYYQHFFEDGSGLRFKNYKDMILGSELKFKETKKLKNLTVEYIYTKNQSGIGAHNVSGGNDSYYENYIYGTWSYEGMIIGNPLFLMNNKMDNMEQTRIKAFHMGLNGEISEKNSYRIMATEGRYYGTCRDVGKSVFYKGKREIYLLAEIERKKIFGNENTEGKIGIGYDDGEIQSSFGIRTELKYKY